MKISAYLLCIGHIKDPAARNITRYVPENTEVCLSRPMSLTRGINYALVSHWKKS